MMMMKLYNEQTNECDLQAKTYPTICTHHKVHNNNENKFPVYIMWLCWQVETNGT